MCSAPARAAAEGWRAKGQSSWVGRSPPAQSSATPLSEAEAVDLVKDCFATAGERDIYTGDGVDIWIINKDGLRVEHQDLKLD